MTEGGLKPIQPLMLAVLADLNRLSLQKFLFPRNQLLRIPRPRLPNDAAEVPQILFLLASFRFLARIRPDKRVCPKLLLEAFPSRRRRQLRRPDPFHRLKQRQEHQQLFHLLLCR